MTIELNVNKIKGLMRERDESQKDLALAINIAASTLNNYLSRKACIRLDTLNDIAKHYNTEPLSLLIFNQ